MTDLRPAPLDLVPLSERVRYMRFFRYALMLAVAGFAVGAPATRVVSAAGVAVGIAGYLAVALVGDLVWHRAAGRALFVFSAMLIVDGVFLAWASYATGGPLSPVRFLILVHLTAVALLASYRTGMKIAMWHTLLLFVVYYAQEAEILEPLGAGSGRLPGSEYARLVMFVLAAWASTIATATFSAVNERELRRRRFDLESLAQLSAELEGAADSFDVADLLLARVVDTFGFPRSLLLGTPDVDLVLLARRQSEQPIGSTCTAGAGSVVLRAWESRQTVLVAGVDPLVDPWLAGALPDAKNLIITPLTAEGRTVGLLVLEHSMRQGSRVERRVVAMVERFAAHAGLALRNAWLLEQVQRMATTDGLTGIANRRSFDTTLERELSRAARNREPVSLVMLDLDHFKQLNDTHGHQVGDDVLREVAGALAENSRDFDTAARYGGEEFGVIIPGCGPDEAVAAAERLRQVVATCGSTVPVTTSLGVASFPMHGEDAASLLRAADDALYQSKRTGRNRVTLARRPGEVGPERTVSVAP